MQNKTKSRTARPCDFFCPIFPLARNLEYARHYVHTISYEQNGKVIFYRHGVFTAYKAHRISLQDMDVACARCGNRGHISYCAERNLYALHFDGRRAHRALSQSRGGDCKRRPKARQLPRLCVHDNRTHDCTSPCCFVPCAQKSP